MEVASHSAAANDIDDFYQQSFGVLLDDTFTGDL